MCVCFFFFLILISKIMVYQQECVVPSCGWGTHKKSRRIIMIDKTKQEIGAFCNVELD